MHRTQHRDFPGVAIFHNGDWSGDVYVMYKLPDWPYNKWIVEGKKLLMGDVGSAPVDESGAPVPVEVVARAIALAVYYVSHDRMMKWAESKL